MPGYTFTYYVNLYVLPRTSVFHKKNGNNNISLNYLQRAPRKIKLINECESTVQIKKGQRAMFDLTVTVLGI